MNKFLIKFLFLFYSSFYYGQDYNFIKNNSNFSFAALEYSIGKTASANVFFPELKAQNGVLISIGKTNFKNNLEWAYRLNFPKTGVTFSYVDYGNSEKIGTAFSIIPFLDFKVFSKFTNKMNLKIGLGASYFNKIYNEVDNPYNKAISMHYNWAFRSNFYYNLIENKDYNLKFGLGYFHNSNGHLQLPNYGLNTFLLSASSQFNFKVESPLDTITLKHSRTKQSYFTSRFGLGQKVLSKDDLKKEFVYTYSASIGKIINKTYKYGFGFYYRFYEDYYKYIKNDGAVVTEKYPEFKKNTFLSASNIGVFTNGEILLSHVGIEMELGINIYKPFYKVDWTLNQFVYVNDSLQPKELTNYYKIKKTVSTRLGAKLYLINTNKLPINNLFLGAFINANLGQADFSELTLGYVYCFNSKSKKQ